MQINYIILAHRNPNQVKRLIQKLKAPEVFFYVHVDKNVLLDSFSKELIDLPNVSYVKDRREVIWGDVEIVNATINSLKQILKDKRNGYCVLLSGQDYPIKSNNDINSFLTENSGSEFIDVFSLPIKYWSTSRIDKYKFNLSSKKEDFIQISSALEAEFFTKKTVKKIYRLIKAGRYDFIFKILKRRKFPNYIKPFGGSQWWVLRNETVEKVISFLKDHPDYLEYHMYSLIPDEMFFQSIIMYLIENKSDIKIMPSLTYANWEKENCDLPVTFTSIDFEELIYQPDFKLFARKFDLRVDHEIFNKIDTFHSKTN